MASGTRLTLWHKIDHRYIAWGAAGWHISFDVLDRLLARELRSVDSLERDAVKLGAWQAIEGGVRNPIWHRECQRIREGRGATVNQSESWKCSWRCI